MPKVPDLPNSTFKQAMDASENVLQLVESAIGLYQGMVSTGLPEELAQQTTMGIIREQTVAAVKKNYG